MKKIIARILAGLLICGVVFAGCGNSESPKTTESSSSDSGDNSDVSDNSDVNSDTGSEASDDSGLKKNSDGLVEIYTADDLVAYREFANNEMNEAHKNDMTEKGCKTGFILMDDIDMSSVTDWIPIGQKAVESGGSYSSGTIEDTVIDGNNHSISNLNINTERCALIEWMGGTDVKNLTFKNCSFHGEQNTAAIAFSAGNANFTNITLEDTVSIVSDKSYAGALLIDSESIIFDNCNSAATIKGVNDNYWVAHLLESDRETQFNNCNNTGSVSSSDN